MTDGTDFIARPDLTPGSVAGEGPAARIARPQSGPGRDRPTIGRADLEDIYMSAIASQFESGGDVLRYSSRMRLLDLAARIGISPFEANLLIERARYRVARASTSAGSAAEEPSVDWASHVSSHWLAAIAAALLLDLAAILWLLH
ncbi:MAG: hypothetical protein BIFFINMI_00566 [Phycisphaerae bacterium]|nr:hypothetical protein [Phycisphaerae bacterium]